MRHTNPIIKRFVGTEIDYDEESLCIDRGWCRLLECTEASGIVPTVQRKFCCSHIHVHGAERNVKAGPVFTNEIIKLD